MEGSRTPTDLERADAELRAAAKILLSFKRNGGIVEPEYQRNVMTGNTRLKLKYYKHDDDRKGKHVKSTNSLYSNYGTVDFEVIAGVNYEPLAANYVK